MVESFSEMKSDKPSPHQKMGFFSGMAWSLGTMFSAKEVWLLFLVVVMVFLLLFLVVVVVVVFCCCDYCLFQ